MGSLEQVRLLQARLDETTSINTALIRHQQRYMDNIGQRLTNVERSATFRHAGNIQSSSPSMAGASRAAAGLSSWRFGGPAAEENDEEEEGIYADMPPLEESDESWRSSRATLPPAVPVADDLQSVRRRDAHRLRSRDEALESLRSDTAFRARVRQYMHPDTASRILNVLDRSSEDRQPTQPAAPQPQQGDQMPGTPRSDARVRWELAKGFVDRNGDFVQRRSAQLQHHIGR